MNSTGNPLTGDSLIKEVEISNPIGISDSLDFRLKKSSAPCRSLRSVISCANKSSLTHNDVAQIYFPIRKSTYINQESSYLMFQATPSAGCTIDHSAYTFIQAINIYSGNQLIESITNYNVLAPALIDVSLTPTDVISKNIEWGMSGTPFSLSTNTSAAVTTNTSRKGTALGTGGATFCLPLIGSAILGTSSERYYPLDTQDQLRLEITFNTQNNSSVEGTAAITWTNVKFVSRFLELGTVAQSLVDRIGENYLLHGCSWRNYVSTAQASVGQQVFSIGSAFSSMKQLLVCPLDQFQTVGTAYKNSSRVYPWSSAYLSLAGQPVPATPITTPEEAYTELQCAWDSADSAMLNGLFDKAGYSATYGTNTGAASYLNNHLFCINLDAYSKKSSVISSGIDSLGISSGTQFVANMTAGAMIQLQAFAQFDMVVVIDRAGAVSVKY